MVNRVGTVEPRTARLRLGRADLVARSAQGPGVRARSAPGRSSSPCWWTAIPRRCGPCSSSGSAAHAEPALCREVEKVLPLVHRLTPELRLPLVSMAVPALWRLSRDQFEAFAAGVRELVRGRQPGEPLRVRLAAAPLPPPGRPLRQSPRRPRIRYAIGRNSWSVRCGTSWGPWPTSAARSRRTRPALSPWGSRRWAGPGSIPLCRRATWTSKSLDRALNELDAAAPPLKRRILAACAACIGADGQVTLEEGELLRAIADSLGCPVPPLQSLAGAGAVGVNPPA